MPQLVRQPDIAKQPAPFRVLLAGGLPLVRTAIACLIASHPDMDVIAECPSQPAALAAAMIERPHVVVLDLDCEAQRSIPAEIQAAVHPCPILTLTRSHDPKETVSLSHGASGLVHKSDSAADLLGAIRVVASGRSWIRGRINSVLCDGCARRTDNCQDTLREPLTRRESEIVKLVSLGLRNRMIAERLFITETTVRHHLTSIFCKLAVKNRLELMRYSYRGVHDSAGAG
ncbi:MAG: response regulator transcription factor [Thermoanaerobaculia bacterium]